ncbi:hypothetical protein QQ008_04595 [Fulvivirgaceae bacterium BMA10]|uniref:Viral A-type inclusion protein n=1 Tax=Splendidivirga corallicola TaxID=3051826 RepID=A0ABT8KIT4_9BACT|nr:hypothetical protein [Fulvivirgaceae bacterium BMA10]
MKNLSIFFAFLVCLFIISCSGGRDTKVEQQEISEEEQAEQALLDETLEIHDDVMPKHHYLLKLKKNLQHRADSLTNLETENAEKVDELKALMVDLEDAYQGMSDWMHDFERANEGMSHEDIMDYYQHEKEKIQSVREKMLSAISNAEHALSE